METKELKSVLSTDQQNVIERLLSAIQTMRGELATEQAHSVGDKIENALLYDRAGWGHSTEELLNHRSAIIMLFSGDMCQQQHEELIKYDELLAASNIEINLIVVTPDRSAASSCAAQVIMEDEPIFDDKNNLIFDMEVEGVVENEEEELIRATIEYQESQEVTHHYKIMSDVDGNFTRKHKLHYSLSDEVSDLFDKELSIKHDRDLYIPAIYIVNDSGAICYAHLNSDRYKRPEPKDIIEAYAALTTIL